jgi:DNA-binding XRE family transcriptional regulator
MEVWKMPKTKIESIGVIVRKLRADKSQREFGKVLGGIPASVICAIEKEKRQPSKSVAKRLAEFSGLPLETFIR